MSINNDPSKSMELFLAKKPPHSQIFTLNFLVQHHSSAHAGNRALVTN